MQYMYEILRLFKIKASALYSYNPYILIVASQKLTSMFRNVLQYIVSHRQLVPNQLTKTTDYAECPSEQRPITYNFPATLFLIPPPSQKTYLILSVGDVRLTINNNSLSII